MKTMLEPHPKKIKKSFQYDPSLQDQGEDMIIEETPEMLAAIDEGLRSAEMEKCIPIAVVRAELKKKWDTL